MTSMSTWLTTTSHTIVNAEYANLGLKCFSVKTLQNLRGNKQLNGYCCNCKHQVVPLTAGISARFCGHNQDRFHRAPLLAAVVLARRFSDSVALEEGRDSNLSGNLRQFRTSTSRPVCMAATALDNEVAASGAGPRVAVIGGGLAGLAASVEILRHGGRVVVIEKCDRLGGNSAKASSGMNAAESAPQRALGLEDSLPEFVEDTIRSGKGLANEELVEILVSNSAAAVDFLQGFQIDLSSIARLGGHSHARTHRVGFDGKAMNVGYRIMSALTRFLEDQPANKVEVVKNARVTELLFREEHQICGVRCKVASKQDDGQEVSKSLDIPVSAVILATGGFCADRAGLLAHYAPKMRHLATTNGPFATGDGVRLGVQAGADLVDMDQVQLHPTAFVNPQDPCNTTKFLAPEALRGCGGVLLNHRGERFVNELATRDAVVGGILAHCESLEVPGGASSEGPVVAYLVLSAAGVQAFDKPTTDFYISRGLIQKFENAAELSRTLNLPEGAVRKTLDEYGHGKQEEHPEADRGWQEGVHLPSEHTPPLQGGSSKDPFGRPAFPSLLNPDEELYVAVVTPALHYCMGGLRFSQLAQILCPDGTPIGGFYGAGEVTGGLHGGNRLAGNSLLECVVFGRIAGEQAWRHALTQQQQQQL